MRNESRHRNAVRLWLSLVIVVVALASLSGLLAQVQQQPPDRSQRDVANYVRDNVLGGDFGNRTLWMTSAPVDQTHVLRDPILKRKFDLRIPYPKAWVVMIDDQPKANFGHNVRWLLIDEQLSKHTDPIKKDFPPLVLTKDGTGPAVAFRCVPGVTPVACEDTASLPKEVIRPSARVADSCLYAVLVSGGISSASNYSRYQQNLRSMYNLLRGCGYPAAHIYVYYADGAALDLDNADGDNNDATGSDITAGANESAIRQRIQDLCKTLDKKRDVLFTYFTNHGADDDGVCLWDATNNGLDDNELYSPAELGADTANCSVCRQLMIHDQCYSGDFLPLASDGSHANLAIYVAASATEVSWGREYMAQWEKNDPGSSTMNAMHQDVVANGHLQSTPGMAEGTAGLGNHSPCDCCKWCPWWCWLVIIIVIIIIIIIVIIIIRRRTPPRPNPPDPLGTRE